MVQEWVHFLTCGVYRNCHMLVCRMKNWVLRSLSSKISNHQRRTSSRLVLWSISAELLTRLLVMEENFQNYILIVLTFIHVCCVKD